MGLSALPSGTGAARGQRLIGTRRIAGQGFLCRATEKQPRTAASAEDDVQARQTTLGEHDERGHCPR